MGKHMTARIKALETTKPGQKKCKYADKYKAKYPPRCQPLCEVCLEKWLLKDH